MNPRLPFAEGARLARAVLPDPADLWVGPWDRDDDDGTVEAGPSGALADECLPGGFPEDDVLAAADATFVHRRGHQLVHAASTVFTTPGAAAVAASMLAQPDFVRCFMVSVAADVQVEPTVALLGPVVFPPADATGVAPQEQVSAVTSRAVLAAVDAGAAASISVDVGVVRGGPVVVLVWAARRSGPAGDKGWERLVGATVRRCAAALAAG